MMTVRFEKKTANGEGTIVLRSDGRWMGRLSVSRDTDGKTHRITVYGKTRDQVEWKIQSLQQGRVQSTKELTALERIRQLEERVAELERVLFVVIEEKVKITEIKSPWVDKNV
jgi:hypothetical protein